MKAPRQSGHSPYFPCSGARAVVLAALMLAGSVHADVIFNPGLELGDFAAGDDIVKLADTLTLKAEVIDYITPSGFEPISVETVLTVVVDASAPVRTADPGIEWQFGGGTFDVDQGGVTLLEGTLDAFFLTTNGNFAAALSYTGGTLRGAFTGGDLVGSLFDSGFSPMQYLGADLGADFVMDGLTSSKIGPVSFPVPAPSVLVLLIPALAAFRRR